MDAMGFRFSGHGFPFPQEMPVILNIKTQFLRLDNRYYTATKNNNNNNNKNNNNKKKKKRQQVTTTSNNKRKQHTTVDGWNPAPPRMMIIPLFIGF